MSPKNRPDNRWGLFLCLITMQVWPKVQKNKLYRYIKLQGSLLTGMGQVYIYTHRPAMKTNIAVVLPQSPY
jgi:hypothetical protein